ncbi:partial Oxygen regulatory protein NreC, partial [Anaerolineae bacterium]
ISVKTVERHRENIMQKLNLHTRTELVKYAIRKGIISLDED